MANPQSLAQSNALKIKAGKTKSGECKACKLNQQIARSGGHAKVPPLHPNCACQASYVSKRTMKSRNIRSSNNTMINSFFNKN
jgi:hypothetical protein